MIWQEVAYVLTVKIQSAKSVVGLIVLMKTLKKLRSAKIIIAVQNVGGESMNNEMTTDNMSNEEVIEVLKGMGFCCNFDRTTLKEREALDLAIKLLEKRPQGEWRFDGWGTYCSECGYRPKIGGGKFCSECGAKMSNSV